MGSDWFSDWDIPDFSKLKEFVAIIQEMTFPVVEAARRFQEVMRPIVEVTDQVFHRLQEIGQAAGELLRPIAAAQEMGKVQFVYWDYLDDDIQKTIIESKNKNKVLQQYFVSENYQIIEEAIKAIDDNPLLKKRQRLYRQAVKAFQNGDYDLAINGMTSVFDGLLSDISMNPSHKLQPRIDVIIQKLETEKVLDHDEYSVLTLAITFEKTIETFGKPSDFSGKEPKGLNRHWIAHGRSIRKRTKLDCIKMINLIYGLLLIGELDKAER